MEKAQFRKKVYLRSELSTLVHAAESLGPSWISDSQICYPSAFQLLTYNIQDETHAIVSRSARESVILAVEFKAEVNESHCEALYVIRQKQSFYLIRRPTEPLQRILLFRNKRQNQKYNEQKTFKEEKTHNRSALIIKTAKRLQEQIHLAEEQEGVASTSQWSMTAVSQLLWMHQINFCLLIVTIGGRQSLILANLGRRQLSSEQQICPIVLLNGNCQAEIGKRGELMYAGRVAFIFQEEVKQVHRTPDCTVVILAMETQMLLIKINFDDMSLQLIHRLPFSKSRTVKAENIKICSMEDQIFITAFLSEPKLRGSSQKYENSSKRYLKLYYLKNGQIHAATQYAPSDRQLRYQFQVQEAKTLRLIEQEKKTMKRSRTKKSIVSNESALQPSARVSHNLFLGVLDLITQKQKHAHFQQVKQESVESSQKQIQGSDIQLQIEQLPIGEGRMRDLEGFICNKGVILAWQKESCVIHQISIISQRIYEERIQKQGRLREGRVSKQQNQMKQMYSRLMGFRMAENQDDDRSHCYLEYRGRIELFLECGRIRNLCLSQKNYNLLVVSQHGEDSGEGTVGHHLFQFDLFAQLPASDPGIYLRPLGHIFRGKPVESIIKSKSGETVYVQSGGKIHSLQAELLQGAISFDLHPYNMFIAVSFGFAVKVYALEGTKLTSICTINGQGMRKVRFSPGGSQLCILSNKTIRIVDSYSFAVKYLLIEKNSHFVDAHYCTVRPEFFTLSENGSIGFYSSGDYSKIDSIRISLPQLQLRSLQLIVNSVHQQLILILESGGIHIYYPPEAIVVLHEQTLFYSDGEVIRKAIIDGKNGVLFVGCASGIIRSHVWPLRQSGSFDFFTEIKVAFSEITCMSLSSGSPTLLVGCHSGNVSVYKYYVDRQKNENSNENQNVLFSQKNSKFLSMASQNGMTRLYKFCLTSFTSNAQDLPQKVKLQFKLSEVMQRLNDQMKRMKNQIKCELDQKQRKNNDKFDLTMLHHLNQMVNTSLQAQITSVQEQYFKTKKELKQQFKKNMSLITNQQLELQKQKTILQSENCLFRKNLKIELQNQMNKFLKEIAKKKEQMNCLQVKIGFQRGQCQQEAFFIPTDCLQLYQNQKTELQNILLQENQKHFELRKAMAYKQTAIHNLLKRKVKEQTTDFKINLQLEQMRKKLQNQRMIKQQLTEEIKMAEGKMNKAQSHGAIIKSNAQFKRIASLDTMNDACSYKLWVKDKFETEISDLSQYLQHLEELLQNKGNDVVDLILDTNLKSQNGNKMKTKICQVKKNLMKTKRISLDCKNKVIQVVRDNAQTDKIDINGLLQSNSEDPCLFQMNQTHSPFSNRLPLQSPTNSTSEIDQILSNRANNRIISTYHKIWDKSNRFLKSGVKIHHRQINKYGKQNDTLLKEYEILKYENQKLISKQKYNLNQIDVVKNSLLQVEKHFQQRSSKKKHSMHKTSYQKYVENKNNPISKVNAYKTAVTTPIKGHSPWKNVGQK